LAASNKERVSAQRKARLEAGWTEVRIWAASRDDVQTIRQFTDHLRMETIRKKVRHIGREQNTPAGVIERALEALNLQDSPEFNTPSGATLTLLTDLARSQQLHDLNSVVKMFSVAYPGNARLVIESVPAKVLSSNIAYRLDYRASERILKYQAAHPDLSSEIHAAIENFTLDAWADAAVQEMRGYDLDQADAATA
jgi:hypothetical protein